MPPYVPAIGLEVHAQLATASKMFCACPVVDPATAPANAAVCPVCLGHPGTLPRLNDRAVHLGVRVALALGATLHARSTFARKHYFYPDLPKGYQVSQHREPFATGGSVHLPGRTIALERIHFEEDAGKSLHEGARTSLDWNRAGVPLVEIVGEPALASPAEAEAYLRVLHRVLVASGACTGDMEKGHFRCDANVSIARPGAPRGTRVEIKNLNSFRFVARALAAEIERQGALLDAGSPVPMETRTWDGTRTVLLRRKEGPTDYRYLPEPDLPPLVLTPDEVAAARAALPGAPLDVHLAEADAERVRAWVEDHGVSPHDAAVLSSHPELGEFFGRCLRESLPPRAAAAWLTGEVLRHGGPGRLEPAALASVQRTLDAGAINRDGAKRLVAVLVDRGGDVPGLVADLGLGQITGRDALLPIARRVVAAEPAAAAKFRAGNGALLGFFVGKIMAATDRRADPALAAELAREALAEGTTGEGGG